MSRLLETILLENGKMPLLKYHNDRLNKSRSQFFSDSRYLDLEQEINVPKQYAKGTFKVRVIYSDQIEKIEILPFASRIIKSIKLIHADEISYEHKWEDRTHLKALYDQRSGHDEILIVKNGYLTDCFYYNLVLYDGENWLTPKNCLLHGARREMLLSQNKIKLAKIALEDLPRFSMISLINGLTPFKSILLSTAQVTS